MVVLTVTTTENPHTVNFDYPIPKPSHIRLLSSHIPTWFNLKEDGTILVKDEKDTKENTVTVPFAADYYTLEMLTMSSANVLPSAPAYGDREETQLYPSLPTNAENFRLTEISKIEKEISAEAEHYRLVLKKYKKVRKVIHYSVVCLGAVTAALSSGAVATSLTGVGIVIGAPVAAVAAVSGAASTGLSVINKKLERKVNKHSRILALAVAKHDSINSSVSQALNDNLVSDKEFQLILREMQKYRQLKETFRSIFAHKQTNSQPDIEKIRQEIMKAERQKMKKKLLESTTDISK
ncbi:hypothetical protein ACROYT_G028839 [Oculina patagonica]